MLFCEKSSAARDSHRILGPQSPLNQLGPLTLCHIPYVHLQNKRVPLISLTGASACQSTTA